MDIQIRGKNVHVSEALKRATREKLARIDRFADGHGRIEVDYYELRNRRIHDNQVCEVLVHLKGHLVKAHAASTDLHAALDLVVDKVEHQAKKLKDRRVERWHPRRSRLHPDASPEDLLFEPDDDEFAANGDGVAGLEDHGRIVKTKLVEIKPMTPDEAALQMDLLGHDFFVFISAETSHAAVLYRRHDGRLGLIETSR
jgi:putative sigma-54 modulation protein